MQPLPVRLPGDDYEIPLAFSSPRSMISPLSWFRKELVLEWCSRKPRKFQIPSLISVHPKSPLKFIQKVVDITLGALFLNPSAWFLSVSKFLAHESAVQENYFPISLGGECHA